MLWWNNVIVLELKGWKLEDFNTDLQFSNVTPVAVIAVNVSTDFRSPEAWKTIINISVNFKKVGSKRSFKVL